MNNPDILELTEIETKANSGYVLILHNDDFNTFDWVIKCLVNVCHQNKLQAEQCANIVHFNGKCDVKRGDKETVLLLLKQLQDAKLTASMELIEN